MLLSSGVGERWVADVELQMNLVVGVVESVVPPRPRFRGPRFHVSSEKYAAEHSHTLGVDAVPRHHLRENKGNQRCVHDRPLWAHQPVSISIVALVIKEMT